MERRQHWIAVLSSALLHLLFLFLMMLSDPVAVTAPQGAAAGSRVVVDFIGETPPPPRTKPAKKRPPASRVQTTLVEHADDPVPPIVVDAATQDDAPVPVETPPPPPTPTPQAPRRRPHVWGQPPGMLPQDVAPVNAGPANSSATSRGRGNASSAAPSMEVDGYQVYYDLISETRLRAWRDQGMTELFLPLPGTRRYMICPLETALRRESGPCRLLEPDSPELKDIGDAREAINMQRVYRQGEIVWDGPGAYR
jgi:hypothetical protein